jgi:hypothetical protein
MIFQQDNNPKAIISRIHWKLTTAWCDAKYFNGKPNIAFVSKTHSPIVESNDYDNRLIAKEMNLKQTIEINAGYKILCKFIRDTHDYFRGKSISYADRITKDPVPPKFIFALDQTLAVAIIGSYFLPQLPGALRKFLKQRP